MTDAIDTLDLLDTLDKVDDADDDDDDVRHENLLNSLGVKPDGREKKSKRQQRSEAVEDVSIFSLNAGSKVAAGDLIKGLKGTVNVNLLKKNISKVEQSKSKLNALLPKITADRVERDVAYETSKEKISRWDDIVKKNRKADQLSFPLKHDNLHINTVDDYVQRFKPKTPLEKQIYALLKGNKFEERPETGLSRAEEEALKSVSIQEARRRRSELQKHRALLSYHEAKNRRVGKIKSRRHLRILRKQKEKKAALEFEELQQKDPEGAAEKLKQAQKTRAEERAILRHRQGSKWAKNRLLVSKYNEMTKFQIEEQRKLHSDLVQKNVVNIESSDGDSDEQETPETEVNALVSPTASLPSVYLPKDNPWLRQTKVKIDENKDGSRLEDSEEQSERTYFRTQGAILGLETVTQQKNNDSEDNDSSDEDEEFKIELSEIKKRKKLREELEKEDDGSDSDAKNDEVQEERIKNFKSALAALRKEGRKIPKRTESLTETAELDEISDEDELEVTTERRKHLQDMENVLKTETEVETLSELHRTSKKTTEEKNEAPKLQHIDPNKVFTLQTQEVTSQEPTIVENEDPERERKDSNRMTIQEAFADDDVMAEFVAEKKKTISDSKPKAEDLTLPGWGEWGGIDLKPSRRKRRKFFIKAKPPPPRKDDHLGPVIINEKRDVHIAKHQVNQIPYPYTSEEQYERSIRQPIGQTWNTPSTFRKLTKEKVRTVAGKIIDPMDEEDAFDDKKPEKRKRVLQDDGHIGFNDVTDASVPKRRFKRKRGNKKHKK